MKNNKRKKKFIMLLVAILIILLLIAAIFSIRYFMTRKPKDNEINNNVDFTIAENKAENLDCKNNLENIDVGNVEIYEVNKEIYIVLDLNNKTDNHQFDIPLKLKFINKDGEVIFETGTVKKLLPKQGSDNVYFKITKEIQQAINTGNIIDYIEISKT